MVKFLTALIVALLLSMAQPWLTVASAVEPCNGCDCGCAVTGVCGCSFVKADAPTKLPAKDYSGAAWHPVTGKPDFQWLAGADGKCAGVYQFSSKKWYPMTKDTKGEEEYGPDCPCPVTPPTQVTTVYSAATYYVNPFVTGGQNGTGGCANGQCGGTTSSRGFFRR